MRSRAARAGSDGSEEIGATEFKSRCLELLEVIRKSGREFVITKRGEPVARISPIRSGGSRLRGLLRDQLVIHGDIVHLDLSGDWEASR